MSAYTFLSAIFPHKGLAIYIRNDILYQCQQHLFKTSENLNIIKSRDRKHDSHTFFDQLLITVY